MKRGMVDSNYLEELLEGIPDGLFDGNYSEEDLLKMVDLPMESFANDVSHAEFDVNETQAPWAGAYVGYRPVDSAVWNTVPEQKPKLIPSNGSVSVPELSLSDTSVGLPSVVGDNVMNHVNGNIVPDTLVEVKPMTMPLNGLIMNPGSIPSYGSVGLAPVVGGQVRTGCNAGSDAMEPRPMITPLNGLIFETEPIPSAASFGLPRVVEDNVINHTAHGVLDTVLESKPKLIPSNSFVTKSKPMMVDAMIGSRVVVERQVSENTVGNARTNILPKHKPEIPADGKAKVPESGSSRIHSPVSVLDTSSCNSAQTSISNIKSGGARFGKRSKRPRPEHIKTPWFHITPIIPKKACINKNREKRTPSQYSDRRATENKLFDFPACWKKQATAARGVAGTKKCTHCEVTKTPQWREGPNGPKTLCNACGVRYRSGRLFPEYRPAASPTFTPYLHSNSHRKVVEMRRHQAPPPQENKIIDLTEQDLQGADTAMDTPRSPDSPLIENIPMMGHPFELIY